MRCAEQQFLLRPQLNLRVVLVEPEWLRAYWENKRFLSEIARGGGMKPEPAQGNIFRKTRAQVVIARRSMMGAQCHFRTKTSLQTKALQDKTWLSMSLAGTRPSATRIPVTATSRGRVWGASWR